MEVVQNTVYDSVEDVQDIIDQETEKEILAYYQLPIDIQKDLNAENIEPKHVPTVVSIKVSVANKAESLIRSAIKTFSPLISKTAGMALAPLETYKNILVDTVTQTIGSSNVDYLEDKRGELVFIIYRVTEKEYEIADTFADTYIYPYTGDPNKWVANATAWVLNTQLSCLNESMPGAFEDIWKFNPLSTSRLHIYAVCIEVYPYKFTDSALLTAIKSIFPTMDTESIAAKGVRFYYYDEKQDRMINYYNNIEYWQVSFDLLEEIISEIEEVLEIETSEAEEETAAQIEPTEGKVIYTSSNEIYVMNADSSGQMRLTNNSARERWPVWSPDGKKIAFTRKLDDNWEIYIMNTNGSGLTNLTNNPADDLWSRWLSDEQKIIFYSNRDDKFYWYSINADGSGLENLSYIPGGSPDWSK